MNVKNRVNYPPVDGRPHVDYQLTRQSSIYSLTFDEFQNSMGGIGKDFGSMNMDELLKNIWSAEETQLMASSSVANSVIEVGDWTDGSGHYLQRQGSLTLPRIISQKTVDEVWKDLVKEYSVDQDGAGSLASTNPRRQQTLGETTLEDFLFRVGVVGEDQISEKPENEGISGKTTGLEGNCQPHRELDSISLNDGILGSYNPFPNRPSLNTNATQTGPKQLQLFDKRPPVTCGSQLPSPGVIGGISGVSDQGLNHGLQQGSGLQSDAMGSNGDTSSVSPVPYMFNGGVRRRKISAQSDKVADKRQKRMIKNRESAARSRARKQEYTMELEAEVANLKEENQELRRKLVKLQKEFYLLNEIKTPWYKMKPANRLVYLLQEEIIEMQKNQMMDLQRLLAKKQCMRQAQTSPW